MHKRLNTDYLWIDEAGYNYNGANYLEYTIPLPTERLKIVKRERVMKLKILLFAVMSFPFLWSCDKEEIPVFASNDAGIYFQRLTSTVYGSTTEYYSDSTDFSFAGMYAYYTSHVLNAPVLTMGKVVDYDRPFKVVVDMEESTAIEGKISRSS